MFASPRSPVVSGGVSLHSLSFGPALEAALLAASSSIFIASFVLGLGCSGSSSQTRRIIDILIYKFRDCGLDIRLALSYHAGRSRLGSRSIQGFYYLASVGLPFRFPSIEKSLHAKMCLIDSDVCFVGSHNLFDASFYNPMEVTAEIRDNALVSAAARDFVEWWPCLVSIPFVDGVSWLK